MAADYLLDKTSNANNLTNNNGAAPVFDAPFNGRASSVQFTSASSQYLNASNISAIQLTDLTIEVWVKRTTAGVNQYLVSKWGNSQNSYELGFDPTNHLQMNISSTGVNANAPLSTGATIGTGTWTHVAASYQASTGNIVYYINGSQDSTRTGIVSIFSGSTAQLSIGTENGTNQFYLNGNMAEVRIWNTVRTPTQISTNYNQVLIGNETNLVAYYPMQSNAGGAFLYNFV